MCWQHRVESSCFFLMKSNNSRLSAAQQQHLLRNIRGSVRSQIKSIPRVTINLLYFVTPITMSSWANYGLSALSNVTQSVQALSSYAQVVLHEARQEVARAQCFRSCVRITRSHTFTDDCLRWNLSFLMMPALSAPPRLLPRMQQMTSHSTQLLLAKHQPLLHPGPILFPRRGLWQANHLKPT